MSEDWSEAVRRPPAHRVASRGGGVDATQNCQLLTRVTVGVSVALLACFIALLTGLPNRRDCPCDTSAVYNSTYPLSTVSRDADHTLHYRIAVITDLDTDSKSEGEKNTWFSYFRFGSLHVNKELSKLSISWDAETKTLKSTLSHGARGMELSDLKVFDGHLLTVDDRTGVVYRVDTDQNIVIPWVMLTDGPGNVSKGLKAEWMAVKDQTLYVGGLGKEWTTTLGEFRNLNPMWIKTVSHTGYVTHVDWVNVYKKLRNAAGIFYPGYLVHESGQWSDIHHKWVFLPRRASKEMYTEKTDERMGTNYMLIADETFSNVEVKRIGERLPQRGFSAFQFIPGTKDKLILALKSEEDAGTINSYVMAFDIDGNILIPETKLDGNYKYEGIEFV